MTTVFKNPFCAKGMTLMDRSSHCSFAQPK